MVVDTSNVATRNKVISNNSAKNAMGSSIGKVMGFCKRTELSCSTLPGSTRCRIYIFPKEGGVCDSKDLIVKDLDMDKWSNNLSKDKSMKYN